jgi:hypothetical protein
VTYQALWELPGPTSQEVDFTALISQRRLGSLVPFDEMRLYDQMDERADYSDGVACHLGPIWKTERASLPVKPKP